MQIAKICIPIWQRRLSFRWYFQFGPILILKVSKFQNEFMKSSFLPKYERKIVKAEILTIFHSYFGRNDDFINSFWNLLTFINWTKSLLVISLIFCLFEDGISSELKSPLQCTFFSKRIYVMWEIQVITRPNFTELLTCIKKKFYY